MSELQVLLQQLDELIGEPIVDADDALEIVAVAGLAARLGAPVEALADAVTWRDGPGRELIEAGFAELDVDELLDGLTGVLEGDVAPELVEDALSDIDDVVAAAIWAGHRAEVRLLAQEAADTIRQVPEPFAAISDLGRDMARLPAIARDLDLYDYWLAVADAAQWKDDG